MRAMLAALLLVGCAQASAQTLACGAVAWGGWSGNARCAALAMRPILAADRSCATDDDCAIVHPHASCENVSVRADRVARYRAMETSCTNPSAGPCNPAIAVCAAGCCAAR